MKWNKDCVKGRAADTLNGLKCLRKDTLKVIPPLPRMENFESTPILLLLLMTCIRKIMLSAQ